MKKILIIEDDMEIADVEKDYLELSGLSVTIRNDGLAGYEEALANPYDLILLDLMLPGMDGFEICRKLREKLDIPITIVSADEDDPAVLAGQGNGKCSLRFLFIFQAVGGCIHKNAGYEEAVSFHEDVIITQGYFQCQTLLGE